MNNEMRKHYMTTYTREQTRQIATFTTHLWVGFEEAAKPDHITLDQMEEHAARHSGMVGCVMDLYYYAAWLDQAISDLYKEDETIWDKSPGVFEYEVVEELGQWLFLNPDDFQDGPGVTSAFVAQANQAIRNWFDKEPQPTESSTMTVNELITQLQRLDGALPVLTRGSESTKMVDVSDVRLVKTAKRRAVFIGKPKAVTAD
jgi:hypothetical protein